MARCRCRRTGRDPAADPAAPALSTLGYQMPGYSSRERTPAAMVAAEEEDDEEPATPSIDLRFLLVGGVLAAAAATAARCAWAMSAERTVDASSETWSRAEAAVDAVGSRRAILRARERALLARCTRSEVTRWCESGVSLSSSASLTVSLRGSEPTPDEMRRRFAGDPRLRRAAGRARAEEPRAEP